MQVFYLKKDYGTYFVPRLKILRDENNWKKAPLIESPNASAPAVKNVFVANWNPNRISPSTKARIMLKAIPPGTRGIKPGSVNMMTGERSLRAKI